MAEPSTKLPSRSGAQPSTPSSTSVSTSAARSTNDGPTVPPKSKLQPYYSISSLWSDIEPIPQIDSAPGIPDSVPVLAPIAYTPRYAEAMSYLRAVMAANEYSERCLALTEDLIGMNPAHYTVWIYRMRILKHLWGLTPNTTTTSAAAAAASNEGKARGEDNKAEASPPSLSQTELEKKIMAELTWLNSVSARNLKNYQIWHHRHSLVDLLSLTPDSSYFTTEQAFLRQILSLDTKNYHVWSYRQWLCARFPDPLLLPTDDNTELGAMEEMIADDVRNNSAWNHRYFVVFGHRELQEAEKAGVPLKDVSLAASASDERSVHTLQRELEYTQAKIRLAPQNGSSWNYLKGILRHQPQPQQQQQQQLLLLREFCEEFIGLDGDLWTVNNSGTGQRGVRSSHAVEWLSDTYGSDGTEQGRQRARECLQALADKWDPIRRKYWQWRVRGLEEKWKNEQLQ